MIPHFVTAPFLFAGWFLYNSVEFILVVCKVNNFGAKER